MDFGWDLERMDKSATFAVQKDSAEWSSGSSLGS